VSNSRRPREKATVWCSCILSYYQVPATQPLPCGFKEKNWHRKTLSTTKP
jgi:hypothetical protein